MQRQIHNERSSAKLPANKKRFILMAGGAGFEPALLSKFAAHLDMVGADNAKFDVNKLKLI